LARFGLFKLDCIYREGTEERRPHPAWPVSGSHRFGCVPFYLTFQKDDTPIAVKLVRSSISRL
jgi:hypothetical protein